MESYKLLFFYKQQQHWIDPAARISRQLKGTTEPFDLYFGVKFYAADPCKLLEEITRLVDFNFRLNNFLF